MHEITLICIYHYVFNWQKKTDTFMKMLISEHCTIRELGGKRNTPSATKAANHWTLKLPTPSHSYTWLQIMPQVTSAEKKYWSVADKIDTVQELNKFEGYLRWWFHAVSNERIDDFWDLSAVFHEMEANGRTLVVAHESRSELSTDRSVDALYTAGNSRHVGGS